MTSEQIVNEPPLPPTTNLGSSRKNVGEETESSKQFGNKPICKYSLGMQMYKKLEVTGTLSNNRTMQQNRGDWKYDARRSAKEQVQAAATRFTVA